MSNTYELIEDSGEEKKDDTCDNVPPSIEGYGPQYPGYWASDPKPDPNGKKVDPKGPLPQSPDHCQLRESVPWCGKCLTSDQCAGEGSFCCPWLKKCVPSSTYGCSGAYPKCRGCWSDKDLDKCNCGNAEAVGFPEKWAKPLCPAGEESLGTICDDKCVSYMAKKKARDQAAYEAEKNRVAEEAALRKKAEEE